MADDDIEGTNALAGFRNPAQAPASPSLDAIDAAAARYGLHPAVLKGIASIESSMDPESNRKRDTQYKGLFQIGKDEWKQYGRGNIYNPADNADAAARMLADHAQWYRDRQGREPTPGDLYMMHLQGRGFIRNGTMTNVAGNPYPGMRGPQTPESFAQGWTGELGRRMARYGGASSIYANGDATQPQGNALQPQGNQAAQSTIPSPLTSAPQPGLAPPIGGVQAALASLGSPSAGGGTLAGIGKSLMAQAGKTQGLPFPDAKLKPFDENLRPLPLNLPNFAAMAQIPKFAEGGIVDRPTLAMVGENGPEAVVPLTGQQSLEQRMSDPGNDIPRNALDARALLNSGAIRVTHPGDGRGGFSQTNDPNDFSIVSHYNDLAGGTSRWPDKPESREAAIIALNNAHQPGPGPLYNGKYNQILWSAQRLGVNPFKALPPSVPGFAEGGIVDRPTLATVGENGPEAIVPLRPMGMVQPDVIGNRIGAIPAVHNFMSDLLTVLKNKAVSAATAPLDAFTGRMQVSDPTTGMPTPEAMQRGQGVAGTAMTGAFPFAQRGAAGVFGGRLARGANLSELEAAKTFAEHGAHPDDIWKSTGWFQGADKEWRHEIPDTLAQFNKNAPQNGALPQLLTEHPLLYAAYPELKNSKYTIVPGETSSYNGINLIGKHEFEIGRGTLERDPSVVLHEIQHAIQKVEGFATGGTTQRGPFSTPFDDELKPLMKERADLYKKYSGAPIERVPMEVRERAAYLDKVGETHGRLQRAYNKEAFKNYERLAGETEASNVQDRFRMGEMARHPQLTESFPRSEQIVTQSPMATGPKTVTRGQGQMPVKEFMGQGFDPFNRPPPFDFKGAFEALFGGSSNPINPRSERIDFKSAGAQRGSGKVPAERTQPAIETPEAMAKRKAEMKAAFDELMKKGKPEKTKAAPSAPGRIGFKSLGTER